MKKLKLYLAHPTKFMNYVEPYCAMIERNTDIEIVNPFRANKGEAASVQLIRDGKKNPFVSESTEMDKVIVEGDLKIIKECDGVLAFLPREVPSFGTQMEMFYNGFVLGRKDMTFVVSQDFREHPWVRYVCNSRGRFDTFEDFVRWYNKKGKYLLNKNHRKIGKIIRGIIFVEVLLGIGILSLVL